MKIAIVNDLPVAVEALRRVVAQAPQHRVIWTAASGAEAVAQCAQERPDVILMDLIMPGMDGVEATRRIMAATPCAILVVTATVSGTPGRVFDALGAGALDAINTPDCSSGAFGADARALLAKIDMLGRLVGAMPPSAAAPGRVPPARAGSRWLVALGTSAGGPAALVEVLRHFSPSDPVSFVAVSHLDAQFAAGLASWLGQQIKLPVRLAREGDAPQPGTVLLPAREDHLILTREITFRYTASPADCVYRPSVDVFFESLAEHWPGRVAAVLLTGMGRDGARGLARLRAAGHPTMAQDQATSAVYGMPKAAAELGAAGQILPLPRIADGLRTLLSS